MHETRACYTCRKEKPTKAKGEALACILLQFDPPRDLARLQEYAGWFQGEGGELMRRVDGLSELRVYRNVTGESPVVTAIVFFNEMPTALAAARSPFWQQLVGNLTRWGCDGIQVTLLEPSPILPALRSSSS